MRRSGGVKLYLTDFRLLLKVVSHVFASVLLLLGGTTGFTSGKGRKKDYFTLPYLFVRSLNGINE